MGTRNLTMVFKDGKYVVAQYGQWDGYPDGQGLTALTFLRDELNREKFFAGLDLMFEPTDAQIDDFNARLKAENKAPSQLYPSLSRDTCAKILSLIQSTTEPTPIRIDVDYAGDVGCMWAWLADFDKGTFEAYRGHSEPLTTADRFYSVPPDRDLPGYHPIKFAASWPLDSLPDDETFLAAFRSPDDEEQSS